MNARIASSDLEVEYTGLHSLKPFAKNARQHPEKQIALLADAIKEFGFNNPILIDSSNEIIAGHGRVLAAQRLGMTRVPSIRLLHLSEVQRRAFRLADNKLSTLSEWDVGMLSDEVNFLLTHELDFDVGVLGFETAEIDQMRGNYSGQVEAEAPVALPDSTVFAVTRPGDLWSIGPHRVYCGDSLQQSSFQALLGDDRAAAAFCDSPYNVRINGHVSGTARHAEFAMASGEMSSSEFIAFLQKAMTLQVKYSKPGALHFQCIDWRHHFELQTAASKLYEAQTNCCVWVKNNGGMGSQWRSQHELILVFKVAGAAHQNNVMLGKYGRNRTNVWTYDGVNTFRAGRNADLAAHPTCKPIALVADAILDCTKGGDIVLDAFLGSGTTCLAAARTSRRGFGIEIDPKYVDVAVRRLQDETGEIATIASGESFNELAAARPTADEPGR